LHKQLGAPAGRVTLDDVQDFTFVACDSRGALLGPQSLQAFLKNHTLLAPAVDWILNHQDDDLLPIPFDRQDQMRIVTAGAEAAPASVAAFFHTVSSLGLHRAPHSLDVLDAVASLLHPSVAVVGALCEVLPLFTGTPGDLVADEHWASYLMAVSAALGRVSTHVHFAQTERVSAVDGAWSASAGIGSEVVNR
jgi:hypothetical protein